MYKILDLQIPGKEFADGELFRTKQDVVDQLVDFHNNDFSGVNDMDEELTIEEFFKSNKIKTTKAQLEWILDYGGWEIEKQIKCKFCHKMQILSQMDGRKRKIKGKERLKDYHICNPKKELPTKDCNENCTIINGICVKEGKIKLIKQK